MASNKFEEALDGAVQRVARLVRTRLRPAVRAPFVQAMQHDALADNNNDNDDDGDDRHITVATLDAPPNDDVVDSTVSCACSSASLRVKRIYIAVDNRRH
jgi:hypothetical protein